MRKGVFREREEEGPVLFSNSGRGLVMEQKWLSMVITLGLFLMEQGFRFVGKYGFVSGKG